MHRLRPADRMFASGQMRTVAYRGPSSALAQLQKLPPKRERECIDGGDRRPLGPTAATRLILLALCIYSGLWGKLVQFGWIRPGALCALHSAPCSSANGATQADSITYMPTASI